VIRRSSRAPARPSPTPVVLGQGPTDLQPCSSQGPAPTGPAAATCKVKGPVLNFRRPSALPITVSYNLSGVAQAAALGPDTIARGSSRSSIKTWTTLLSRRQPGTRPAEHRESRRAPVAGFRCHRETSRVPDKAAATTWKLGRTRPGLSAVSRPGTARGVRRREGHERRDRLRRLLGRQVGRTQVRVDQNASGKYVSLVVDGVD